MVARSTQRSRTDEGGGAHPDVSVVIPVHAAGPALVSCLQSVQGCDPPPTETIVVLDGDLPEDRALCQGFSVRVLGLSPRQGPAAARNHGARHASGDIVFFVDADVALHGDAVHRVRQALGSSRQAVAVFGSYDDAPAATNFLSQYRNLLHHYVHQHSLAQSSSFWGACGAIRRDVFLEVGGFDERYGRPSIEDIELGDRLHRAGYPVQLDGALQGTHLKRWTPFSVVKTDLVDRAIPWTRLLLERGWPAEDLAIDRRRRLSLASTCLAAVSLVGAPLVPGLLGVTATSLAYNLWVQRDLLHFFARRRGVAFAAGCVPWLWLFDLYSALGLVLGVTAHLLRPPTHRAPEHTT